MQVAYNVLCCFLHLNASMVGDAVGKSHLAIFKQHRKFQ